MATSSPEPSPHSKWQIGDPPWPRLPKWLQKFVRILSRKRDEMSSFRLNNGFKLQKTIRAARCWKQPPKKPFHRESRDRILHDSWSISAALARGFLQSAKEGTLSAHPPHPDPHPTSIH